MRHAHLLSMATQIRTIATWLSAKPHKHSLRVAFGMTTFVTLWTQLFFMDFFHAQDLIAATPDLVFNQHELWRAWTTAWIHADWGHFLSNVFLFLPFSYFLSGYFGLWLIPGLAVASGGLINLVVLKTMPGDASLLGVSGVVYWMGACWLSLYLLLDRRFGWRRRTARALFLALVLFVPDKYSPQVSYLSHLVGFLLGLFTGIVIYFWRRKEFLEAEVTVVDFD